MQSVTATRSPSRGRVFARERENIRQQGFDALSPSGFPAAPPVSIADSPSPPKAPRRAREGRWWFLVPHGLPQQLRQLGDVGGDAPGLVAR